MKPVILLVDDEEDLVSVLRDAIDLSLPDYRAVGSTSIDEAEKELEALDREQQQLSLVCVDHRLGGRTGLEFIESLKQRYPTVPSILFTSQASTAVEDRARLAGAIVLWKPIRLSVWLQEVRKMLAAIEQVPA